METVLLIILLLVCGALWRDVARLRSRVDELEAGGFVRSFEAARVGPAAPPPVPAAALRTPAVTVHSTRQPVAVDLPDSVPEAIEPLAPSPPPQENIPATDEPPADHGEPSPRLGFEELFGRRLPIWAGGVTLAVAGFLIVKYSIDTGLLSPVIRMILGLVFGCALIAAAEVALRRESFVRDPRVRQALSGAGIATLYATILVAANIYQLIGSATAFVGMAVVTAAAIGLSLRFGAPSAVLGLVGGLAAPALVGSDSPNVPLLASYLALTVGGLAAVSRQQRWAWLGVGALIGGFGWGLVLLLGGAMDAGSTISLGILIVLLGVAFPLILLADRGAMLRLGAGLVACAQMAALVAVGGFASLHWALFGLISAAFVFLSRREPTLRDLPSVGLATALLLAGAWPDPDPLLLGAVIAGIGAIFGGPALYRLWRPDGLLADAIAIAAIAAAILVLPMLHHYERSGAADGEFALLALLGSTIAAGAAALGWRSAIRRDDWRFALLVATASALLIAAASLALPVWAIAPASALVASLLLAFARSADDWRIELSAWGFAAVSLFLLATGIDFTRPDQSAAAREMADWLEAFRWIVPAAMAAWFAYRATWRWSGPVAQPIAVLLAYAAASQIVPMHLMYLVPALMIIGLAFAIRPAPAPALITAWALAIIGGILPATEWLMAGTEALLGTPFLSTLVSSPFDVMLKLAIPAAAIAFALRKAPWPRDVRPVVLGSTILFASIAAHSLFKQLLTIDSDPRFVGLGYAERTLWEAQLAALALLAWQLRWRVATIALAAASLAHFLWFSVLLHNPLWAPQSAFPMLIPAFALAFAILYATGRAGLLAHLDRARDAIRIVLIPIFALSVLRLIFAGTMPAAVPIGATEDILRSLLGAAIAIGFLQWGIRVAKRDWRIASLVLMLATVAKVFLRDASGLDGLLRVASFAALGFSLIGIGWLYSRYLPDPRRRDAAAATGP